MRRSLLISCAIVVSVSFAAPAAGRDVGTSTVSDRRTSVPDGARYAEFEWGPARLRGPSLLDPRVAPGRPQRDPAASAAALAEAEAECAERVPHAPIRIAAEEGPLGFILGHDPVTGAPIYRPGSGVTAGTGTAADPYVIEGWCIRRQPTPWIHWQYDPFGAKEATDLVTQAIMIDGTSSHVVVRDNVLPGTLNIWEVGILVEDARNVTVAGNHVSTMWQGIFLYGARDSVISDNTVVDSGLWGIALWSSHDNLIEDNVTTASPSFGGILVSRSDRNRVRTNAVMRNGREGIFVVESAGTSVESNLLSDNERIGVVVLDSSGVLVRGNTVAGSSVGLLMEGNRGSDARSNVIADSGTDGIAVVDSWKTELRANRIEGSARDGVLVVLSIHNVVEGNSITESGRLGILVGGAAVTDIRANTVRRNQGRGMLVEHSDRVDVVESEITENVGGGIGVLSSEAIEIHRNTIAGNGPGGAAGVGIMVDDAPPVEADRNWWGCAGGPGQLGCDRIEGRVLYDPWLTQPNG